MYRLLLPLLMLAGAGLPAQGPSVDSLPAAERQTLFLEDLATLMTEGKPEPVEMAYRDFVGVFHGGNFDEAEKEKIVSLGREMRNHRLGATPYFEHYLTALTKVKQTTDGAKRFQEWTGILEAMLRDEPNYRANAVADFLSFSRDFFTADAIRFSPNSTSWFAFAETVKWRYDQQPIVEMEKARLVANRLDDTLVIEQADFEYYPLEFELLGSKGKTTWERVGLDAEVYVELAEFTIETKRSLYSSSEAYLHYPLYFGDQRIKGTFEDKLVSDNSLTSYPRFESEAAFLNIANVGEGIRLRGGFRLHGTTVYATGTRERLAEVLLLNQRNQPRFRGEGELWTVRNQERLSGSSARAVLFIGADTIYHPSVNVRVDIQDQIIQLTRGDRGSDRNPFFHGLHRMNIDAEYMTAYLREDSIVIGRPTASFANKEDVIFESLDHFNQGDYDRIQSIATANPLAIMRATAEREGSRFMSAELIAQRINSRFTVENIQTLLYDLVRQGFINYDAEEQMIELKDKVFLYVDADQGRGDYDNLRFASKTDTANAVIDLETGYTLLSGVRRVEFSRTQKVATSPQGQQLYIRGNRNFDFDGRLFAGFGVLEGKDFHFEYEPFHVKLDSVRFFDLYVPTGQLDDQGNPVALSIGSRIEHLNGTLLIDAPNNKSGQDDILMFPSLQSEGYSYVYYDRDSTQAGAYGRDSFYFRLDPFSFDHLDRFGPQDVAFEGSMFSGGIFPEFEETLTLQEADQSLGFTRPTPEGGFGTYDDKGRYEGAISLSNQGLLGQGRLEYLNAEVNSEDFIFKPDQTLASADRFDLEEVREGGVPVPQVRGQDVKIDWRPYRDSMLVRSTEETPFELYRSGEHALDGLLVLTPDGLKGDGTLDWPAASATSRIFSFGPNDAVADTMSVRIRALEGDERIALETENVKGNLDFDERQGRFLANDEYLVTTLPYNQYITSMNEFNWDMEASRITFQAEEGKPGIFTSIHPDQDSLRFTGEEATYNLANSLLQISGVPYMVSADAFIYPDSQYVEIAPNAEMAELTNARIVADTTNEYHVINRATVQVRGRRFYQASGWYEYNVGPHEQEVELQNIVGQPVGKGAYSEKATVTRATAEIAPDDEFFIDHKTRFRGTMSLNAESPSLKFDGFAQVDAENLLEKTWFTVSFEGDKNDLVINYDVPKSYDGEPLYTGLYLSREFGRPYPRIFTPLMFRKDRQLFPVWKGVFKYDEERDEFIFGDSSVVIRNEEVGNRMVFRNKDRVVNFSGSFNLGEGLKYVAVTAAGTGITTFPEVPPETEQAVEGEEQESNGGGIMLADAPLTPEPEAEEAAPPQPVGPGFEPTTLEVMLGTHMRIPEPLLRIIENDFKSATFDSRAITYLTDIGFYRRAAQEIFPPGKETSDAMDGLSLGFLDLPKRLNTYNLLFSRVPLRWEPDYQSFISTNKNLGLVSINGESVNKMVEAYIELRMPSADDDDRLYIYLKSPSGLFYFFGFKQGILSITSNNTVFMETINEMKVKDLVLRMEDGETFEILPVEASNATVFLRRITAVQ